MPMWQWRHSDMEDTIKNLVADLEEKLTHLTSTRELSVVKTKLDELRMWLREHFEKVPADVGPDVG